jgi:hypothetical protein
MQLYIPGLRAHTYHTWEPRSNTFALGFVQAVVQSFLIIMYYCELEWGVCMHM